MLVIYYNAKPMLYHSLQSINACSNFGLNMNKTRLSRASVGCQFIGETLNPIAKLYVGLMPGMNRL